MKKLKHILNCFISKRLILLLICLLHATLPAQIYPVQISTQLVPPYSGYLPDYADPSSEKLKIILQFNDFTKPQYDVKLKLEIKGNGFSLVTKQLYNPPPITLQPGAPYIITGSDLAPYLNSNNLDFIGINQSQYEQRMALPEGFYSICVTAYDYFNPNKITVSNTACSNAWFTYSDPPFLNLPLCNKVVTPQTPQNIVFQWVPGNMGSPLSAGNTEYEFALWEAKPDSSVNPNQIVLSTAPIYSTTTQLTIVNYGITEPPLNLYNKYIWRVRAKDISGRDWFKNNGWSQVCTFLYGSITTVLGNNIQLNLTAQGITHRLGLCIWNSNSIFSNYTLQVRKAGTTHWFEYPTTASSEKVTNLEPDTDYEARVRGENSSYTGDWSSIANFRTLSEPNYNCGDQTQLNDPLPANPLPSAKAKPGLIIQTGQFEVSVTEIAPNGGQGWYKGKGFAKVMGLPMAVEFSSIYIDDNNRHQQGVIRAITQGITTWTHQWDIKYAEENATYVNGTIDSVYVNGNQICVSFQGNAQDTCFDAPNQNVVVVRDENGNQYTIQTNPPPPKITGPSNYLQPSNDQLDASDSLMVTFEASATQQFGFDKKQYTAWINNYELIKLSGNKNYFVPYKSVGVNQNDEVLAKVVIKNFNLQKLNFKTAGGQNCNAIQDQNNSFKVNLPHNAESVYAWYDGKKIGKLNVIQLKGITKKLVLVPVNGAQLSISNVQDELNKIYKQANVSWSVTLKSSFTYSLNNNHIEPADATLMSKYSGEMRALRDAYRKFDSLYDKEAYHVFVVSGFTGRPELKGYMVRGRALGFVAASSNGTDLAHELGHGAFGLEHTFPAIAKSSSNNLMDYKQGTELGKVQWEEIQSRPPAFIWLGDDEEDAEMKDTRKFLLELLGTFKTAYKNNTTVVVGNSIDKLFIQKTFLNGIDYDYIYMTRIKNKSLISLKNKIFETSTTITQSTNNFTPVSKKSLIIDSTFQIFVPDNRIANLKIYLESTFKSKNLLLFVNGYMTQAPNPVEIPKGPDKIYQNDVFNYWEGIDAQFINRIGTKNVVYADGHHSIITSNHNIESDPVTSQEYFMGNLAQSKAAKLAADLKNYPLPTFTLHTNGNSSGFSTRRTNGTKAGDDLIVKLEQGEFDFNKLEDSIDIVAHSMGYAYALGIIDKLKMKGYSLGRFYIIAPENGCGGSTDWNTFSEVWQYGSNLGIVDADPLYKQDGVAPQCGCPNLPQLPTKRLGRVFIPKEWAPKGFVESHSIGNFGWIFSELKPNDQRGGYVKPR